MTDSRTGEGKIAKLFAAPTMATTFRAAFCTANRIDRCPIAAITLANYHKLILELQREDATSITQMQDGRVLWKGGVILVPFLATERAASELPQWSQLMFVNNRGEIVYGI